MVAAHLNGKQPPDIIKNGYDEWLELLERTQSMHLLSDPFNVWIEAFSVGAMLERYGIAHAIQTQIELASTDENDEQAILTLEEVRQVQINLLQQVLSLLTTQSLRR
jgi:hypothetical protein